MTHNSTHDEDAKLAGMLRVLEDDAAAVDAGALDRMRDRLMAELAGGSLPDAVETQRVAGIDGKGTQGTEEPNGGKDYSASDGLLAKAFAEPAMEDVAEITSTPAVQRVAPVTLTRMANEPASRSSLWSTLVLAVVLGVAAVSLWMTQQANSVVSPMALASVLDDVASADSLRIEARLEGALQEIVVKQPGKARWQVDETHYRVLDGTRLWRVDEDDNTARLEPVAVHGTTRRGSDGETGGTSQRIGLLNLLGVHVSDRRELVRAMPVKQDEVEGVPCSFYEATVAANVGGDVAGDVRIEAVVETRSRKVRSLTVWPAGRVERQAPIADVRLLALNAPVNEEQFVVAKSLSQDGRIGKISDTQGVVTLRPTLHDRWTPVCQEVLLKPGDSIRTDLRGPHAVRITLTSEVQLTLGPGSLLEVVLSLIHI